EKLETFVVRCSVTAVGKRLPEQRRIAEPVAQPAFDRLVRHGVTGGATASLAAARLEIDAGAEIAEQLYFGLVNGGQNHRIPIASDLDVTRRDRLDVVDLGALVEQRLDFAGRTARLRGTRKF